MINIYDIMSRKNLSKMIDDGYISKRPHPSAPLFILNYTQKCQYDWLWNRETIQCRGLIVDDHDNVIVRPWPKFFTPAQYKDLRNSMSHLYGVRYKDMYKGQFTTTEKADGFLAILYWIDGEPNITTRGSFTSPQAQLATTLFREKYAHEWIKKIGVGQPHTYLFEGIFPAYRIVVDYKGMEDLVLLDVLDNKTGLSLPLPNYKDGPLVVKHHDFDSFEEIGKIKRDNREGFVVHFIDSNLKVKIKHEEYLLLHKLMCGCTERRVWEMLRKDEGGEHTFMYLTNQVPEDFANQLYDVSDKLNQRFDELYRRARDRAEYFRKRKMSRKDIAYELRNDEDKGRIFGFLDGKEESKQFRDAIWKAIKPTSSTFIAHGATK